MVRATAAKAKPLMLRTAVLTTGGRAAVLEGTRVVSRAALGALLKPIQQDAFNEAGLQKLGQGLADLLLPPEIRAILRTFSRQHVTILHDADAARIPWEALRIDDWVPALGAGMSRSYLSPDVAIGRWTEHRERQGNLALLLIVDPLGDLAGAVQESDMIANIAAVNPRITVTRLMQGDATRERVLDAFRSEAHDVIHYAGHAMFDADAPGDSGIECANGRLKAVDLLQLRSLPPLLFFNACESARMRAVRGRRRPPRRRDVRRELEKMVSFAEVFMRHGVMNYIGTYWPVGDRTASAFAPEFYQAVVAGKSIGEALLAGRMRVRSLKSIDWADYIHYGDRKFTVKANAPRTEPDYTRSSADGP
jgi:CHAT domain-containing protein